MPSISSDARFLGVDLALLWRDMREPWRTAHQWPILAWLTPQPAVLLLRADGTQAVWEGATQISAKVTPRFKAIELPDDLVLRRAVQLPAMSADDLLAAMSLEARSNSPFDADDLVWGGSLQTNASQPVQRAELVLASRKQVAQHLAAVQAGAAGVDWSGAEVWVIAANGQPVVFTGYGEGLREAYRRNRRRLAFGLLAALALGGAVLAITPSIQLRSRALEAAQAHETLVKSAAPVVRQREQLMASVESLSALAELTNGRIEPLKVLDKLTQVLPDDTALQSIKLQGTKLIFTGQTGNASALLQQLGNVQGFKDVRAPAATTRLGNVGKEAFAVELTLDPEVFGVKSTQLASPVLSPSGGASSPVIPAPTAAASATAEPALAASGPSMPGASAPQPGVVAPQSPTNAAVGNQPQQGASAPVPSGAGSAPAGRPRASFGGRAAAPVPPAAPAQSPASAPSQKRAPS